ncbi:putative bifunctional diguanylate cyclase/phosphodiesterase [Paraglaciecola marina]|uniref:putative bifunctional diguanylate cyclase/phosphodiesterase n=1 Tax=Paraglaciecola marina TaxID=2500157 RepID=UPI00105FEE37|nr:bifunctional diguanylate cyclase/phosphodiesterase [Paraglaciecola marina]
MDASLLKTLGLLDCIIIQRVNTNEFEVLYMSNNWATELLPEAVGIFTFSEDSSPYLLDFLIDAKNLWNSEKDGKIDSGIWSEQLPSQLIRLEATAFYKNKNQFLQINKIDTSYEEKQKTLQIARELMFSADKISEQHEYLHAKMDELLSGPTQTFFLKQQISQALEQTDLGVAILTPELQIVNSNPALKALFTDSNIKINIPEDRLVIELFRTQYPECERIFSTGSTWSGELYWLNPPRHGKWLKMTIHPIMSANQVIQYWILSVSDITQIKFLLKRNEKLVHFDAVTDLPNRQFFWKKLEEKVNQSLPFCLLYCDIKNFKRINELYGHQIGDQAIKELASRLNSITQGDDLLARIGGTEFAVIMNLKEGSPSQSIKYQEQCSKFAEELINSCRIPFYPAPGQKCEIGLNVGAAVFPLDSSNAEELMKYADLAVYSAKKQKSQSSIQFYSKQLIEASRKRIEMEDALRVAIKNQEFEIFLQPILDLSTNKIVKAEALIRWRQKGHALVSPEEFIPLAEQTGLIIPIGKWVISEAFRLLAQLNKQGESISIAINLSPRQISDRQLFEFIQSNVDEYKINAQKVEFELTEGVLIDNYEKVHLLLEQIHELGMKVSIDDFGTGYSSLSYLQKLRIDHLKIDRAFIKELTESSKEGDFALILAIISMAKSLNLGVIAEGVETQVQRNFLVTNNCNVAQGYLFSPPLPFIDFCQLLKGNS